jgi:hypothetical protein
MASSDLQYEKPSAGHVRPGAARLPAAHSLLAESSAGISQRRDRAVSRAGFELHGPC